MSNLANSPDIKEILLKHGVEEAFLFGSYAKGSNSSDSDIDLLVTFKPGINLFEFADLQHELEESTGKRVDIVSKKYISKRLSKRIKNDLVQVLG